MAGLLSKGITLSYKEGEDFIEIPNLQEIPDLGGAPERVDVTTLADENYTYIAGIKDFGEMAFTFLYDNEDETSNYRIVRGLEETGEFIDWKVEFPDGTQFLFSGQVAAAITGAGVNAALQFTANITLNSEIEVVNA